MAEPGTLLYLARRDVVRAAAGVDAVAVVRDALVLHAGARSTLPPEAYLGWETPGGAAARSLALPGALWGPAPVLGVKIVNSSLANPARGLPRAHGLTVLFDRDTARPVALLEGAYLSALRTSAYTALSVSLLATPGADRVAVLGCGALGSAHVRVLGRTCPGARFVLYDEVAARAEALRAQADGVDCCTAASAEEAVRGSGVVVTTTTTTSGYLPWAWLSPGALVAHVSLDDVLPEVVERAGLVLVDDWPLVCGDDRRLLGRLYRAGRLAGPAGEVYDGAGPGGRRVDGTLGDVVTGRHPGRGSVDDVVLSNPFGMGILDVALAAEVVRHAGRAGLGVVLDT